MMPLSMRSFPLQLESIMFSLMVFSAILLGAGLAKGETAGRLNSHDLAKRAAGDDPVALVVSVRAGIRNRHRVKRQWVAPSPTGGPYATGPYQGTAAAIPTQNVPPYTGKRPATTPWYNYWPTQPYQGPTAYRNTYGPPKQSNPYYRGTGGTGGTGSAFQTTQSWGWVPSLSWTGSNTGGPWRPVHTNPARPPVHKSTEQPEVIEFSPSPDPQSASDNMTFVIIGAVSGGVLIIVIAFVIIAVVLSRHRGRSVADVENDTKVLPPPVVSNTPLNSYKGKMGIKGIDNDGSLYEN